MSLLTLRRLAVSALHTRPQQLAHRLRLTAQRALQQRVVRARPVALDAAPPPRSAAPPLPIFPPRRQLVGWDDGAPSFTGLAMRHPLTPPVAWDPPELRTGTGLRRLTLHYMEYLEALDDDRFVALVDDWLAGNPPWRPGYWQAEWNSYGLSIRCVVWMQQLAVRPLLPAGFTARVHAALAGQLRFLERNLELDIRGNHLVRNIRALAWAGAYFQGDEARRWQETALRLLPGELADQVLPDGVHFERSPAYHTQVFADLTECWHVLPDGAVRRQLGTALDAMAQAVADLTHPDGAISLFNDGGLAMTWPPGLCLETHATLRGQPPPRPRAVFAMPDAGYFGARAGDALVLADCGRIGADHLPAHAHGDALSFEWSVAGRRVVVDPGVFEYGPGPRRACDRGTRAHSTVTVDDADQAEFWGAFRVARRPDVRVEEFDAAPAGAAGPAFVLAGSHTGFRNLAGRPLHRRRFRAAPLRIDVEDEVRGGAGQRVTARLLLHPDCRVEPVEGGARIRSGPVTVLLESAHPIAIEDAVWHPDFKVELATRRIRIDYGAAPARGAFTLRSRQDAGETDAGRTDTGRTDAGRADAGDATAGASS
jgi:uncharacterized heparinase superfamily protein